LHNSKVCNQFNTVQYDGAVGSRRSRGTVSAVDVNPAIRFRIIFNTHFTNVRVLCRNLEEAICRAPLFSSMLRACFDNIHQLLSLVPRNPKFYSQELFSTRILRKIQLTTAHCVQGILRKIQLTTAHCVQGILRKIQLTTVHWVQRKIQLTTAHCVQGILLKIQLTTVHCVQGILLKIQLTTVHCVQGILRKIHLTTVRVQCPLCPRDSTQNSTPHCPLCSTTIRV
jgi:hypothetical protein